MRKWKMKLANETLTVLQNFASINQNIEFKQGKKLRTISPGKTVLASATIPDEIPQTFCVHDLNQFLSVHSLNKETELDFDTQHVIFKSGRSKTKYRTTAKNMIVSPRIFIYASCWIAQNMHNFFHVIIILAQKKPSNGPKAGMHLL